MTNSDYLNNLACDDVTDAHNSDCNKEDLNPLGASLYLYRFLKPGQSNQNTEYPTPSRKIHSSNIHPAWHQLESTQVQTLHPSAGSGIFGQPSVFPVKILSRPH